MGPLNHINEYKLDKNCFHLTFLGKDLPMEAGMISKSQCSLRKTFVVYHIQESRNNC